MIQSCHDCVSLLARGAGLLCLSWIALGCADAQQAATGAEGWWKGNLHTHSLWSDGDHYPESIVAWYEENGYHFIALSDHDVLARGERWIRAEESRGGMEAFHEYLSRFGDDWVERREAGGALEVRLKTFAEYRTLFEEPGGFLVLQAEEISASFQQRPIHVNATNLVDRIAPEGGDSALEVLQRNVDAVLAQRAWSGVPMLPHVSHPNYRWAVTARDLARLRGDRLFEVYNGHPLVNDAGDELHPSTEEMWDVVLTERLTSGMDAMYGIAVDDAHNHLDFGPDRSNPGRGWVMVRAHELTPEALVAALESGDFYATTGVVLERVDAGPDQVALAIRPEPGVTYRTRFIGTRRGDERNDGAIGALLAEEEGLSPSYTLRGDEIYVRATVISSKRKANAGVRGETERAWVQPVVPGR